MTARMAVFGRKFRSELAFRRGSCGRIVREAADGRINHPNWADRSRCRRDCRVKLFGPKAWLPESRTSYASSSVRRLVCGGRRGGGPSLGAEDAYVTHAGGAGHAA